MASKKKKKKKKEFSFLIGKIDMQLENKGGFFPLGIGPKFGPAGITDKALVYDKKVLNRIYLPYFVLSFAKL